MPLYFLQLPESEYIVPDYSEHSMYPASQIVPKVVLEDEVVSEDNMTYEFPSEKTYTNLEASTLKQNKAMQLFSEEGALCTVITISTTTVVSLHLLLPL